MGVSITAWGVKPVLIGEVIRRTGLTRKAVYYYVNERLITPSADPWNGYKNYSEEDVNKLITIARLRRLNVPIQTIRRVLESPGRLDLVLHKHLQAEQDKASQLLYSIKELGDLLQHLPPNSGLAQLAQALTGMNATARPSNSHDLMQEAFPEMEGRKFALLIWEAYLDKPLVTQEQWQAWNRIIRCV